MNVDRLIQTYNHILEHPKTWSQWSQNSWHYGTVHSFAGHGQINSGKEIDNETCQEDAQEWYGLTDDDAEWLFSVHRTLPEIYSFVKAAKDGVVFFDVEGFNRFGYDRYGYDRYGYDFEGYDEAGYDRDGYNHVGYNRAGLNREGFDHSGNPRLPLL